jgi:hypothetical protein
MQGNASNCVGADEYVWRMLAIQQFPYMCGICEILDTDKMESPALFSFKELYKSALVLQYEKDYPQVKQKRENLLWKISFSAWSSQTIARLNEYGRGMAKVCGVATRSRHNKWKSA